jgi:2-polyprenyl-3-methyl-5-hydroxy-6-metoxy-1,4-benzoquinol methylase
MYSPSESDAGGAGHPGTKRDGELVSRYETDIDLENPNNSQTQLITLVGRDKKVLDVGCAAGDTAAVMTMRGCQVSGVDIDAEAAEPAREVLDELVIANIDLSPLSNHFKPQSFDAIIFGDVLEHLVDPWAALRDCHVLLRPGGRVIVSIPNVAHASVRLALLTGRWDYTDKGLLDRTHLRFFTEESVVDLLESSGYAVDELRSTVLDPLAAQEITLQTDMLPPGLVEWARTERSTTSTSPPRRPWSPAPLAPRARASCRRSPTPTAGCATATPRPPSRSARPSTRR